MPTYNPSDAPPIPGDRPVPIHRRGIARLFPRLPHAVASFLALLVAFTPGSALAVDRMFATFGPLQLSISFEDLEKYATTGEITQELGSYIRAANPEQRQALRQLLVRQVNLNATTVSYLAYSPTGEVLLDRLGQVMKTGAGQNGKIALRAALVNATGSPEGLTLLSLLREFPTPELRVDLKAALAIIQEARHLFLEQQQRLVDVVQTNANQQASATVADFAQALDLRQPGVFTWEKQELLWQDDRRQRAIPVHVYLPDRAQPAPVVVISHGVGGNRLSFRYLAEHLVSHGFGVVVPEHPGSNETRLRDIFQGLTQAEPRETLDRLEDITLVLDRLDSLSRWNRDWRGRMDLQQVAIVGQSFGGYTALALGGATLNLPALTAHCQPNQLQRSLNLSLLLQCRIPELAPAIQAGRTVSLLGLRPNPTQSALPLPRFVSGDLQNPTQQFWDFRNPRVKAVIAINPFSSLVFGPEGLGRMEVPVMMVASRNDIIVPFSVEQLYPFTWLQMPQRYFVFLDRGTHFSAIEELPPSQSIFTMPRALLGPSPHIAQTYLKALSLAFLNTHLSGQPPTTPYLTSAYGQYLNNSEMPLSVLSNLDPALLDPSLNPILNPTLDPDLNSSGDLPSDGLFNDPNLNALINLSANSALSPTLNSPLNPTLNPPLNPSANPDLNPSLNSFVNPDLN